MKTSHLVSILMPVKNAAPFLNECIESIIQQNLPDWELIAVNDGSDDNSEEILQHFAAQDNRIKVLNNEGHGIIDALRIAFKNSVGGFITRMDADDLMSPDKLNLFLDKLKIYGKGHLCIGHVKYISGTQLGQGYKQYEIWLNRLTSQASNFEEIYKECVVPSPNWMLHREDLINCGAFDSDVYPEDYDLCFRMRSANLKIVSIKKITHFWRDHPDRFSRNDPHYADNRFLDLKCSYFLKEDRDTNLPLILWGAGNKGKSIAQIFVRENISFHWMSNNSKKIGLDIYGVEIESEEFLEKIKNPQIIIAIAAKDAQADIEKKLSELKNKNSFYFC